MGCAAVGFFTPIAMLVYYSVTDAGAGQLSVTLCPVCIASMALDHATLSMAIAAWTMFCIINAVLYAIPALLFVLISSFRNRN